MKKGFSLRLAERLMSARVLVVLVFAAITAYMLMSALNIKVDAGFAKNVPQEHEYMVTYFDHQQEFGGANRVLIALEDTSGDIFNAQFFERLEAVTKSIQSIPGVDQSQVSSLFTPNTRFTEITEEGFEGGPVVPADFRPEPDDLERVRENVLKAGIVGRLVANDFSAAMITAQLLETDPQTGEKLDYIKFAENLEKEVHAQLQDGSVKPHIIGFAKMIGDVSKGARGVLMFFAIAIAITAVLLYLFTHSARLTLLPIVCSLTAVVWQLGSLNLLGFGIDPMSILVPFLVFAIGVSHSVQLVNAFATQLSTGLSPLPAIQNACSRVWGPGISGLLSDVIGFLTLLLIKIEIIQELAITAALGVGMLLFTNLILLPVLLSWVKPSQRFNDRIAAQHAAQAKWWDNISALSLRRYAWIPVVIAAGLFVVGYVGGQRMFVGDSQAGAPQLRPNSVYNQDTRFITEHFSIGVDLITVIVESAEESCSNFDRLNAIDEFAWSMSNVPGVQSVISLADVAKIVNSATFEGNMNWRVLSRDQAVLAQATRLVPTSSGLLNAECTVVPVMIFTEDHKADTIDRVVGAVKAYRDQHPKEGMTLRLATGPVGVMAATNEAVKEAKWPMLGGVYGAVILLCLLSFRSIRGTIAVVVPLMLVSLLAEAVMAAMGIGLTVYTLPVVALGVGVGVDYGIYIFSQMRGYLREGHSVQWSYRETLHVTGSAVLFTGLTLAIGVATWMLSALQFQADMGSLLTFMFVLNMLGAVLLLPALAAYLFPKHHD